MPNNEELEKEIKHLKMINDQLQSGWADEYNRAEKASADCLKWRKKVLELEKMIKDELTSLLERFDKKQE